jgi:regulator of replication initiation timing
MNAETFNQKLQELIREIANLPKEKQQQLASLVEETKARHKEIKGNVEKITRSLSDLRICVKYLLFDLEATRRERDQLKTRLKNHPPNEDDNPDIANNEI